MIDEEGTKLGVVPTAQAIQTAQERGLDLVEVSPVAKPPVCKIMDFGKVLYQKEKEARKQKAKIKKSEFKGIRLTIKIGQHDFDTKVSQAEKFLEKGHKIKINLVMRGREKAHQDLAREIIQKFIEAISLETAIQQPVKKEGGRLTAVIAKK